MDRLHQHPDQFQQAIADQQRQEDGADGHDQPYRDHQLVEQERQHVRLVEEGRPPAGERHQRRHHAGDLEHAEHSLGDATPPAPGEQRVGGPGDDHRHGIEAVGIPQQGAHPADHVVQGDGGAATQGDRHEEDQDAQQAGHEQLEDGSERGASDGLRCLGWPCHGRVLRCRCLAGSMTLNMYIQYKETTHHPMPL
jgi:hypothetical protein